MRWVDLYRTALMWGYNGNKVKNIKFQKIKVLQYITFIFIFDNVPWTGITKLYGLNVSKYTCIYFSEISQHAKNKKINGLANFVCSFIIRISAFLN